MRLTLTKWIRINRRSPIDAVTLHEVASNGGVCERFRSGADPNVAAFRPQITKPVAATRRRTSNDTFTPGASSAQFSRIRIHQRPIVRTDGPRINADVADLRRGTPCFRLADPLH